MEKIPTLFTRNPNCMRLVTSDVNPDAEWVLRGEGVATVKRDGTNVRVTVRSGAVVNVEKRRNPTREEKAKGAEPGYVQADESDPSDQHIFSAVRGTDVSAWPDGAHSCEALGPKIQGGAEGVVPCLYPFTFGATKLHADPRTFEEIKAVLSASEIEGIVWHHMDGRMAKIKRRDFDFKWPVR